MDIYKRTEAIMNMTDAVWLRHANPWSVWTRFTCLPLICLAIWSRTWVGWWALLWFALAIFWTWLNPRVFPKPNDFGSWASRAVLGERIFLKREVYDVPQHHVMAAYALSVISAIGLPPLAWGLYHLNAWAVIAGAALLVLPKVWFCDRMVWIHAELTHTQPGTRLMDPRMPDERKSHDDST